MGIAEKKNFKEVCVTSRVDIVPKSPRRMFGSPTPASSFKFDIGSNYGRNRAAELASGEDKIRSEQKG